MPATFETARDEILAAFKTRWDLDSGAHNGGTVPAVRYEGTELAGLPPHDAPWAKVTIRHTLGSQASLASDVGLRRFEKLGIATVQVFAPLEKASGLVQAERLAMVAKKAFEGRSTAGGVWFRNTRIVEVGVDGPWFQMNVIAEFSYDEFT